MRIAFRIRRAMFDAVREDLARPHSFASERVGFVYCRFGRTMGGGLLILAHDYAAVGDADYIDDPSYGALLGPVPFRQALERTLGDAFGIFHIHDHPHRGVARPSSIDLAESARFVPDFFHVRDRLPHGALITSRDTLSGMVWMAERASPLTISEISIVGAPMTVERRSV